jgi:hypothetical protein
MRQQLQAVGGTGWPAYVPPPTVIGQAYGGGYYAGQISTTANGVATHYLIVAPKASGQSTIDNIKWKNGGLTTTGANSVINGPSNTSIITALAATDSNYQAAAFCLNVNNAGGIGGYTDWYIPATYELEVLYYFLKPNTVANATGTGANPYAVSPEPVNTNHTSGSPAQTSATGANGFRTGEANTFFENVYWTSTEISSSNVTNVNFYHGQIDQTALKYSNGTVRLVRRVPV